MDSHLVTPPDGGVVQRVQESRVAPVQMGRVEGEISLKVVDKVI